MAPKPTKVYTPLMRFDKYLFALEDIPLPVPVTYRQIGIFSFSLGAMVILGQIPIVENLINGKLFILSYIGFPIFATWYFTKTNIDGKPPMTFVIDWIAYQFTKGKFNRYERIEKASKYKYTTAITFRKGEKQ